MSIIDLIIIREWLYENNLEFTEDEFDDLMVRIEMNNTPPQKESPTLKLHRPSLDVLDLEAEFLNSDGPEPEEIVAASSEEEALIVGRYFCRENSLDVSDEVLLQCVKRLRDEL